MPWKYSIKWYCKDHASQSQPAHSGGFDYCGAWLDFLDYYCAWVRHVVHSGLGSRGSLHLQHKGHHHYHADSHDSRHNQAYLPSGQPLTGCTFVARLVDLPEVGVLGVVVGAGVGVRLISEGPFRSGVVKFNSIVASRKGSIELGGAGGWRRGEGGVEFEVGRVSGHGIKSAGASSAVDLSILGVIEVDELIQSSPLSISTCLDIWLPLLLVIVL